MRRLAILLGLAACGPSTVTVDAPPAIDAPRTDAAIDGPVIDAPIDGVPAPDAPFPCPGSTFQTFALEGTLDPSATVIAGGVSSIRIAVGFSSEGRLYVATDDAGEGSDHFVLLSITAPALSTTPAPFAKAGLIAVGPAPILFLADENDNDFESWFRRDGTADTELGGISYVAGTGANGGVLEGTIDLVQAFVVVPDTVWLAAVPYATADGGALVSAAQTPAGDGDGDVDAAEWVAYTIPCNP